MQETQETQAQSLGWEDNLEEEMTTQSSILAWRIPWTEEPGELQSMASRRVGRLKLFFKLIFTFGCARSSLLLSGLL